MKFAGNKFLLCTIVAAVFAFSALPAFGDEQVTGRAEITPTLLYSYYVGSIVPLGEGTIIVGDLQAGNLNAILPNTFRINGTMVPTSVTMLPSYEGFTGPVYQLTYPILEFIMSYLPFYDSTMHDYTVSAVCDINMNFVFPGQIMLRGKIPGDINSDNRVNVVDLTLLCGYMFRNTAAPADMGTADVNRDSAVNVRDVIKLASILFAT